MTGRKPKAESPTSSYGFTLIEVLVAIMIFAIAVAAILPLFAVGTAAHRRGIDQTETALLADRVFAKLQAGLHSKKPKNIKDGVMGDGMYRYDAEFFPFDKNDPMCSAFIVKVRVKWKLGGVEQVEEFETVLLRRIRR
ncbi:MAG: type IV pilus modification PilV family protein [Planctomycetota bacterium]|jgi:type II secretion system protein I